MPFSDFTNPYKNPADVRTKCGFCRGNSSRWNWSRRLGRPS